MNIVKATRRYEEWLGRHTPLVKPDLTLKHERMAEAVFPFLRATFYRWMQIWPEVCPDLAKAPPVLAVGDLHVENFGTWRDLEGRLVWGVNDFDEAAVLPYAVDLVRLATSALFAIEEGHLAVKPKDPARRFWRATKNLSPTAVVPMCSKKKTHGCVKALPEFCGIQSIFGKGWTVCRGLANSPRALGKLLSTSCQSEASATRPFGASPVWEVSGTFE
jgi:hypothetical protein